MFPPPDCPPPAAARPAPPNRRRPGPATDAPHREGAHPGARAAAAPLLAQGPHRGYLVLSGSTTMADDVRLSREVSSMTLVRPLLLAGVWLALSGSLLSARGPDSPKPKEAEEVS